MSAAPSAEPEIVIERRGEAGLVTLNRPKALNALTPGMVAALADALDAWRAEPAVTRIVIVGAGGRAFSAGGDIRYLYDLGRAGRVAEAKPFWREEYRLNHALKHYPKPVIALVDGIVMGGGVGISFHNSHRVCTERLAFAMPEVGIGFLPDVGMTWLLPRLPHRIGFYLGLTGQRIGLGDAMALGLATHAIEAVRLPEVLDALLGTAPVDAALAAFGAPHQPTPVMDQRETIARCFAPGSLETIVARLDDEARAGSSFAGETLAALRAKSPTSLALALAAMDYSSTSDFAAALTMEYRIVCRIAEGHDFYEGVRAVVIDKDQRPVWRPASIEALDPAAVVAHMAPLADDLAIGA